MSTPVDPFRERLAAAQDAQIAASGVEDRVRARLLAGAPVTRRTAQPMPRRWVVGGAGLLAAAAAITFFVNTGPTELGARHGDVVLAAGAWVEADDAPARIDFTDGTVVELDQGSAIRIASMDEHGARIVLEHGVADLDVVHTGEADWEIQAGPFTIEVTGTAFQTAWTPDAESFKVHMREGSVQVSGPYLEGGQRVSGTGELEVDLVERRGQLTLKAPEPVVEPEVAPAPAPQRAPVAPDPEPEPTWLDAVEANDFPTAIERVEAAGVDTVLAAEDDKRLLALADAAQQAGRADLRVRVLNTTRSRFPGTDSAAIAAYHLGRRARYEQGDLAAAATWFRTAHDEGTSTTNRQLALGNLMQVLTEAGENRAAKQAAIEYLEEYPTGPHATYAEGLAPRKK